MAIAKKKKSEPSCPLWLATYGDMVTNMLVFFVLLLSMSEVKKDRNFIEFMQAIREAFGYIGGLRAVPYEQVFDPKNVPLAELLIVPVNPEEWAKSPDESVDGKHTAVTALRPREYYDMAGKFMFDQLSAEMSDRNKQLAIRYAEEKLRGLHNQIEVRGHCSRFPVDGSGFADHYALAFERARAVADVLVQHGVERDRIVIVAAGTNEPVVTDAYTVAERQQNDRVEVRQLNRLVGEYGAPPPDEQTDDQPPAAPPAPGGTSLDTQPDEPPGTGVDALLRAAGTSESDTAAESAEPLPPEPPPGEPTASVNEATDTTPDPAVMPEPPTSSALES